FVALPRLALVKDVGKEIAEGRRRRAADGDREIEPFEAERRLFRRVRGLAAQIVSVTAIRIDQRLVGLGDGTEMRRGRPGARIDIRVIPPRPPLVGALDVAHARASVDPEDNVEIHYGS